MFDNQALILLSICTHAQPLQQRVYAPYEYPQFMIVTFKLRSMSTSAVAVEVIQHWDKTYFQSMGMEMSFVSWATILLWK